MRHTAFDRVRVVSLDPTSKGVAYAVLEGSSQLIDWGMKRATPGDSKNAACLKLIEELITFFQPQLIVIEDATGKGSRRCLRVQELLTEVAEVAELAKRNKITCRKVSRHNIHKVFAQYGAQTKYQIVQVLVQRFPELALYQPRLRKPWMSEDERMNIFDAVALALTLVSHTSN